MLPELPSSSDPGPVCESAAGHFSCVCVSFLDSLLGVFLAGALAVQMRAASYRPVNAPVTFAVPVEPLPLTCTVIEVMLPGVLPMVVSCSGI